MKCMPHCHSHRQYIFQEVFWMRFFLLFTIKFYRLNNVREIFVMSTYFCRGNTILNINHALMIENRNFEEKSWMENYQNGNKIKYSHTFWYPFTIIYGNNVGAIKKNYIDIFLLSFASHVPHSWPCTHWVKWT